MAIGSLPFDDTTFDEQDHLNYGIHLLKGKSSRQQPGADFNTTMPVSSLNALPRAVEQLVSPSLKKNDGGEEDVHNGRYVTILVTLLLLSYLFSFGKAIAGHASGCWAMLLAALDANILAHSRLVTTDLYGTLAFVATIFHLYQWLVNNKSNHFYFWCIAISIAQCCKINNVLLYPVSLLSIIAYINYRHPVLSFKRFSIYSLAFVTIHLLIINIAFLFYHSGTALHGYNFRSAFFQKLQGSWMADIPIPLPQSFIDTFDLTQYERESFSGTAQNYLLGELRYQRGFWNYYLVCWLVKTPLFTQVMVLLSVLTSLITRKFRKQSIYFLIIPAFIVIIFLSNSSVQSGYRYLLPVLSLSLIAAGVFIQEIMTRLPKFSTFLFCILIGFPALFNFTNYLSYTSEWQWPKKNAYQYLSDSNLNWGQRRKKIQQFLKEHPGYQLDPPSPVTGKIIVDINAITGITEINTYDWLRNHFSPIAVIEGCYLLYDVKKLPE